jgi:hypothetical protein
LHYKIAILQLHIKKTLLTLSQETLNGETKIFVWTFMVCFFDISTKKFEKKTPDLQLEQMKYRLKGLT